MINIEGRKFVVRLLCADCKTQLNLSNPYDYTELQKHWTQLVLSAALVSGKCPKGCRSTWSDCNINTDLEIIDQETNKHVEFNLFNLLSGKFYKEDYNKICWCSDRVQDEVYYSDKYPAVHGKCGKWLVEYKDE